MLEPIHADAHLLVLSKPSGLLSVPGRGPDKQDCLSARAQAQWPDALIVHRLDMATSGLIVMARGPDMQRTLSMAFASRQVHKTYEAIVQGVLLQKTQSPQGWDDIQIPLSIDWPNRPRSKIDWQQGKPSHTLWQVIPASSHPNSSGSATRVRLQPVTGRTHQLRLHMMAIGHPIWGDNLYAPADVQALSPRLLLHACRLQFVHPVTAQSLDLHSTVPF